jgi:uncharacterized protein YkwD
MTRHGGGRPRCGALVAIVLSGLLLFGVAGAASGQELGPRRTMLALTNQDRARHARDELSFEARLARYAKHHSAAMARRGYIFHSSEKQLQDALSGYDWSLGGENVGVGGSLEGLEEAFMGSETHRKNILRRVYRHAAVGIVRADGHIWITVIFYG